MNVWVVIPCFNDGERLVKLLPSIKKYCDNILVVNDGSTDNTHELLKDIDIGYVELSPNQGKAEALHVGCKRAIDKGATVLVTIDADGQHDPEFIPYLLNKIWGGSKIVFGSRPRDKNMPFVRRFGNGVITCSLRGLFNLNISDALSGYKAFTAEAFKDIVWNPEKRYLVESDIFINVAKYGLSYSEINISTVYVGKGGITKIDGLRILWNVFKRRVVG